MLFALFVFFAAMVFLQLLWPKWIETQGASLAKPGLKFGDLSCRRGRRERRPYIAKPVIRVIGK